MPYTDETVNNLIINVLTNSQYDSITTPSDTELYLITDDPNPVTNVKVNGTSIVSNGEANLVTNTAYNASSNKIATMSDVPTVTSTYSSTGTNAVNGTAVNAALQTLDSSISATSGQAISAITITDGKIASSSKISVGETNQNAFSNVKVGSSTIAADSKTDTLELVASTGVILTPDTTNDKITISAGNVSHNDSASAGSAAPINADQLQGYIASYFQQALVSGTNIKTIESQSLLGSGNISLKTIDGQSIIGNGDIYIPYKAVNTCNLTLNHETANGSTATLSGTINGETMTSMTLTGTATYCNLQSDFSVIVNGKRYLTTVIITNSTVTLACGNKFKEQSLSPQNSSYVWSVTLS